jgi:hypothetical protein
MNEIGGYFELELRQKEISHDNLLKMNSARNCLVHLINIKHINEIHLPHYVCSVVTDVVMRLCPETRIHLYHVDENFYPITEHFQAGDFLYYVNYFGLQDHLIQSLPSCHSIIDNAQAFYSPPLINVDTIYCPRKFFGVSDGGYLNTNVQPLESLEEDTSWEKASHLLKRIDCSATAAYADFQAAESSLRGMPLKQMSRLTKSILSSIDHVYVREKRLTNFKHVHRVLAKKNAMSSFIETALASERFVPFCYPFKTQQAGIIRENLIKNKIYVPTYWPELQSSSELNDAELSFVNDVVCLPIDQRYGELDMIRIIECLKGL